MGVQQARVLRQLIKERPIIGPFSKLSDPAVIEVLGFAGFDFVILDMEHGPTSLESLQGLIRAAELSGIAPIVRIPEGDPGMISRVLDIGAAGVQVPQVSTAEQVKEVVRLARFAPTGERGVCRFVRAAGYSSMEKADYFRESDEAFIVIQIEGSEALRNLKAMLDVQGPDIVFIGPYDLSQSLGVPGQVDHPLVVEKTKQIIAACAERGIAAGNFTEKPESTHNWMNQGLRYMSFSVDVGLLYEGCRRIVSNLKRSQ